MLQNKGTKEAKKSSLPVYVGAVKVHLTDLGQHPSPTHS